MAFLIPKLWFLPYSLATFAVVYLIAYFLVFRRWSPKHRPEASSCFISLVHGTPAVALAAAAILCQHRHARGFAAPNTAFQGAVVDFSTGYFAVDLLHYLVFLPRDCCLYLAHHLATLFVFVTCRYVVARGALPVLVLLALAEATNACENALLLAGMRKSESSAAAVVHRCVAPAFYASFTAARAVAAPAFFCKMCMHYLRRKGGGGGGDELPEWVAISWIVVVGGAILVSILWIANLWMQYIGSAKEEKDNNNSNSNSNIMV